MNPKLRDFLLKSIPYLLSIAGGLTLFILTKDNIKSPSLGDLVNNIAASLLAIPLVFLLYDYSNSRVSRRLSQTMMENMSDKVNLLMLNMIILMRRISGVRGKLTLAAVNKMSDWHPSHVAARLKITRADMDELRKYHDELDALVYKYARENILSAARAADLSAMVRDMAHLINEHKFYSNRKISAKYVVSIVGHITDWLDTDAEMAMNFQRLLQQGTITTEK